MSFDPELRHVRISSSHPVDGSSSAQSETMTVPDISGWMPQT